MDVDLSSEGAFIGIHLLGRSSLALSLACCRLVARALGRLLVGGRKELFPDPAGLKASPLTLHPAF